MSELWSYEPKKCDYDYCYCPNCGARREDGKERRMNERKFEVNEITKILNMMIGGTEPYGDSAIDEQIEINVKTFIDVINWCLDGIYYTARHRNSLYTSEREIGERAYAAMLEWKDWISECEEELA